MNQHLVSHVKNPALVNDNTLHVIGVVSNPMRWNSRYRIFREWAKAMETTPNVKLHIVETAFGDRQFEVTQAGNPRHLQLHTDSHIWIKENMINLGVRYLLPKNWNYVAWIDADVFFDKPGWALETIHQLQHFNVVQPWQNCLDLGFRGGVMQMFDSFGYVDQCGHRKQRHPSEPYKYAHSGFAWACTRAFWEATQGLMDFAILGSGDHHMAWAMLNEVDATIHRGMTSGFFRECHAWQAKAIRFSGLEVGYIPGFIKHSFHGAKVNRKYRERWAILEHFKFDPEKDLAYDTQGLLRLIGKPSLEKAIRKYNLERNEDSILEF